MKKVLLITLLCLVFAACITSAGCTLFTTGFVGTWHSESNNDEFIFESDGTGKFVSDEGEYPFTWTVIKDGGNTKAAVYYTTRNYDSELTISGDGTTIWNQGGHHFKRSY